MWIINMVHVAWVNASYDSFVFQPWIRSIMCLFACVRVCVRIIAHCTLLCYLSLSPPMPGQHHAPSISHPLTSHVCTCREKGAVSSISTALHPARPSPAAALKLFSLVSNLSLTPPLPQLTLPYFDCKPQYTFNIYHRSYIVNRY